MCLAVKLRDGVLSEQPINPILEHWLGLANRVVQKRRRIKR
jgi:hypothetical protein